MTKDDDESASERRPRRPRDLWILTGAWTLAIAAMSYWWLQDRLGEHRERSAATAAVRLTGVKDTLAITFRQLAALPLDLSHRRLVPAFVAGSHAANSAAEQVEIQQTLDRLASDFGIPLAAFIDRTGTLVAINASARSARASIQGNFANREYFVEAMASGTAVQFLLGRASGVPGLYFSSRVLNDGQPVGVALVKQDTDRLNRLLADTDGARVFVTDVNGVVVLSNHNDLMLKRVPGGQNRDDALWQEVYQRVPAPLDWTQGRLADSPHGALYTRIGDTRHLTLSSALGDLAPLKVWVLEPLDQEIPLTRSAWTGGVLLWVIGCLLIWLSWRRMQSVDAALRARRDIVELARTLPLTVFRYTRPARGAPRFAFIGRGAQELFGVPAEAIESDPVLPWRLAGSGDAPPTQPQEFRVPGHPDPARGGRWILADSAPRTEPDGSTVYNGYWLDVTTRRETELRFAALFEHAPTSYLFFDPQRGITHCNPAALKLFGATDAQRLIGRVPWFPGLSADEQADGRPSRTRALADLRSHTMRGDRVHSFEWRFRRLDGTEFDADVNVIALEWAGTPEFCAVIQDITERKQMLAATERARAAAEAASQTKSSFLANMSHELRTPMNAIIGMTHLALDDGLPDKQRDYVEKAHHSARNLLQILNDILDVSKIEAGQMVLERIDFELESVVGEMADVLGLKADEKGLELLFTAAPDLPRRLIGDPTRLRQVLVNLGSNAIKFTDAGDVTVGMEITHQDADAIELHGWVKDTGVGLSEEEISRLFQPFVQADSSTTRRFGGTGLGLVISRQLIERMGGRLWVESTPGVGSTFHFSARFGRSAPRAPARAWMANELRGRRALLVDDSAAALDVLGGMLEALGVIVDRAQSGAEALELLGAEPAGYTWFLIDWKMPDMDGVECARRILERHPQLHPCILLVTAFARDDAVRACAGLPLAGVLHKPVTPSSLHDSLVQARRQEPPPVTARRATGNPPLSLAVRQRLAGARVLLAEDHPLNQQLACELLRRAGIEVVVAKDGREALDKLATEGPFDGVLMDCQMPVMDGYTATRELRARPEWQRLPVIAMTASALTEDRDRALASGMNAHITKPIHVESMLRTMAQWISAPGAPPLEAEPVALPAGAASGGAAIDTVAGRAFCMGNDDLYRRLLEGFRANESGFVAEVGAALDEQRWGDALRRSHDMKGLAGTLGAHALLAAAQALHTALAARRARPALGEMEHVAAELDRVLAQIDELVPQR
ncbi:MAG: response regulator [Pseudomonadota bacterium]